jgi:hypothetical protein
MIQDRHPGQGFKSLHQYVLQEKIISSKMCIHWFHLQVSIELSHRQQRQNISALFQNAFPSRKKLTLYYPCTCMILFVYNILHHVVILLYCLPQDKSMTYRGYSSLCSVWASGMMMFQEVLSWWSQNDQWGAFTSHRIIFSSKFNNIWYNWVYLALGYIHNHCL